MMLVMIFWSHWPGAGLRRWRRRRSWRSPSSRSIPCSSRPGLCLSIGGGSFSKTAIQGDLSFNPFPPDHRLNMELDLQCLFGLQCTAVLIGWDPATPHFPRLWTVASDFKISHWLLKFVNIIDCSAWQHLVSNKQEFFWKNRDILLLSLAHYSFLPTNEPGNGNGVKIQLA